MGMRIRRRRYELHNITTLGDVNELSISGHVQHQPVLREDHDGELVYEFVLTHTTLSLSGRWELQRYTVQAYGQLGEHYGANWQPGQTTIVDGRLEYQLCDTLAGPLPNVSIIVHCIDDMEFP
jgi:single-stranded DNA-binding protein